MSANVCPDYMEYRLHVRLPTVRREGIVQLRPKGDMDWPTPKVDVWSIYHPWESTVYVCSRPANTSSSR